VPGGLVTKFPTRCCACHLSLRATSVDIRRRMIPFERRWCREVRNRRFVNIGEALAVRIANVSQRVPRKLTTTVARWSLNDQPEVTSGGRSNEARSAGP
jgi:hypothetical protein